MKTKQFSILLLAILLVACFPVQKTSVTSKTYADTHKSSEKITVSYKLPVIKSTGKTTQSQTKGGVIISVEIIPFTANQNIKQDKTITYADHDKSGYDVYEVSNTPYYSVSPNNIQFKIRIRNNEQVPLKLSEVGFALIIDGTQWSFPSGYMDDWNKGLILTGFEKEYVINGSDLSGLYNAQVVYLFLNGVPTEYNEAGSITKKDNFEWYFACKTEEVKKDEQRTYTYETSPIYKEKCQKCNGTGTDPQPYKCTTCNGSGIVIGIIDGKRYTCSKCNGTGIIHYRCSNCSGTGEISYPKSKEAPVTSSITWNGWGVNVETIPSGATIKAVTTKEGEYAEAPCTSPCNIAWYCTSGKSCPIILEYNGQTVKVLPYKPDGSESSRVLVDFLNGTPIVKKGKKVD